MNPQHVADVEVWWVELVVEAEHTELEVELPASDSLLAEVGTEEELASFELIRATR
jgi:hypothetical protein